LTVGQRRRRKATHHDFKTTESPTASNNYSDSCKPDEKKTKTPLELVEDTQPQKVSRRFTAMMVDGEGNAAVGGRIVSCMDKRLSKDEKGANRFRDRTIK
jgi:hypothetical protein